ncbi:hypothetical protein ACLQ2R_37555 [Streptosporangium sp. DT93]|uniref:hypothetical protein n=1 Tax=Streptosporangium sp. DT93 TaxID=3393428 RepID=UPI003CE949CB
MVVNPSLADRGETADVPDNTLNTDRPETTISLTDWRRFVQSSAEQRRTFLNHKANNPHIEARTSHPCELAALSPATTAHDTRGDDLLCGVIPLRLFDPSKEAKQWP